MKTTLLGILLVGLTAFSPRHLLAATPATHLTYQQEIGLYQAITSLDNGGSKNVDGKATAYAFDFSGHTRVALTHDLNAVTPVKIAFEKRQAELTLQIAGGKAVDQNDAVFQSKLQIAMAAELSQPDPHQPTLETISIADLKLDSNPILFRTQSLLQPVLIE